jgi:hypothetical protein
MDFSNTMSEQSQSTKSEQDLMRRHTALQSAISDLGGDIHTVLNQKNARIRELEAQVEALKKLDSLAQAQVKHRLTPLATRDQ